MAVDFSARDILHRITVKFANAVLPGAKKRYYLKTVHQPELDLHAVASKAALYNVTTPPRVIEEGLAAGMELIAYLAADGYRIKTPLFTLDIRIPGEYDGTETCLPGGVYPAARIQPGGAFRDYLKEKVQVTFDGIARYEGSIAEALDEASGLSDEVMTMGKILTLYGSGLKITSDNEHKDKVGIYFTPESGTAIKAEFVALNEPRTLKALVPASLTRGAAYRIVVRTQSSLSAGHIVKEIREIVSGFTLTAQ